MKKHLLLLMVLSILLLTKDTYIKAQVPNTTTFNLQNVVNTVVPTTNDLLDCFTDANADYWNYYYKDQYYSTYGSANNLLMFRDYGSHNANLSCVVTSAGVSNNTTTTTLSVQSPTGLAIGNMILLVFLADNGGTVTTPTGYTELSHTVTSSHFTCALYYKEYSGGALGDVTISNGGGSSFNKTLQTFRFTDITSLTSSTGGNTFDVSTFSGNSNVTVGFYSVAVFSAHDNSMAATYPTVSKDYYSSSSASFYNSVFSIKVACARLSYQKYEWYWAGGTADYLNYSIFSNDDL